jgi:hypothetical protein
MHRTMACIFIPALFYCLANELLESDPGATVGGAAELGAAEETLATEGKHLHIDLLFLYKLNEHNSAIWLILVSSGTRLCQ